MVLKKILRILKNARRFHYRRFEDESSLVEEREEEPVGPPEVPNVPSKESQTRDLISFTDISMTQQHEKEEERQEEPVGPSKAQNVPFTESQMEDLISFTDISMTQQNKNEEEPVGPSEVPNVSSKESQMEDLISFTDISMTQQNKKEEERQEEPVGRPEAPNVPSKENQMEDLISFTDISMTQQNKNQEERQEEPVGLSKAQNVPSKESQMEDLISFSDINMTQQHENEEDILIATFQSQIQAWEDEKLENENQDDFLMKLLSQENTNLEKEIQRVQQSVQSFGSLEQQSRNDSSELQLLRQRNAELRAELQALQRKEEEIKFQNALLKNDMKSETEEGLTLENQLCKLNRQYSQGLMENSKTKSELNALQKTNTDLLEKRYHLRDMIRQLEEEEAKVLDLKKQNNETVQEIEKFQDKLVDLLEFKITFFPSKDELEAAQDQNSQHKEQQSKLELEIQQDQTPAMTTPAVSAQVSPPRSKIQPKKPVQSTTQHPAVRQPGEKSKTGLEGKQPSTKTQQAKAAVRKTLSPAEKEAEQQRLRELERGWRFYGRK